MKSWKCEGWYTTTSGIRPLSVSEVVGRVRNSRGQARKPNECSLKTPGLLLASPRPFTTYLANLCLFTKHSKVNEGMKRQDT